MPKQVVTILTEHGLEILRQKSAPVAFTVLGDGNVCLDAATNDIIKDLKQYVIDNDGLGMSAIQLGLPIAIFVMRKPWNSNNIVTIINPKILRREGSVVKSEGCFSVPLPPRTGIKVKRADKIYVEYDTEFGDRITDELFTDMDARVFQHELDHLNCILTIDESRFIGWDNNKVNV